MVNAYSVVGRRWEGEDDEVQGGTAALHTWDVSLDTPTKCGSGYSQVGQSYFCRGWRYC